MTRATSTIMLPPVVVSLGTMSAEQALRQAAAQMARSSPGD
jgi:hypothetical protein